MHKILSFWLAGFICFLFFVNTACSKQSMTTTIQDTTHSSDNAKTLLALGDSYTIGQSVDPNQNFPEQTVDVLKAAGINMNPPRIIATTGWTTIDLQNGINLQNPQGPFDAVTLLIGVNDQYQGLDTGGYKIRFTQLLQESIAFAGNDTAHVFVLSIPDYSVTPFAANYDTAKIRIQLQEFNSINKQISLSYHVTYIDITPLTEEMKTNTALVADDGLHPSALEYMQWVNLLAPAMEKVLK